MDFFRHYSELLAAFSYLIPLIPAYILFNKYGFEFRLFFIVLSLGFVVTIVGYYTAKYYINNLLIYFTLYVLEFYLYSILFKRLLSTKFGKRFINVMIILFILIIILNYKSTIEVKYYNSYTAAFISLAMLLYCILFFNLQMDNLQVIFIYKTFWFWAMTGLLMFYAGNFLIFLFTDYLMYRDIDTSKMLWDLRDLFDIIKNLLIATGFLFIKNEQWKKSF